MKFEEVIEHLRNGKKISRKEFRPGYYIRAVMPKEAPDKPFEYQLIGNNEGFDEDIIADEMQLSGIDILAIDWFCL